MRSLGIFLLSLCAVAMAAETPNHVLARKVRENPRGDEAKQAVRELDQRGPEGWRTIAGLIRDVARKDTGAARGFVKTLAKGSEAGRIEALRSVWRESLPAVVRGDLAVALAAGFTPGDSLLIRAVFDAEMPRRVELLRALARRGLATAELRKALEDPQLAADAYTILLERGVELPPDQLRELAKAIMDIAPSQPSMKDFCGALVKGKRWPLVESIALLTGDKDAALAGAAHIFMLRISGLDMPRDADVWRSWIAARRSEYQAPTDNSPGRIAAAVLLGVEMLRKDLLEDGRSEMQGGQHVEGATALTVLALAAAGVRAEDPAIQRAIRTTLLPRNDQGIAALPDTARRHNYTCSLLLMALAKVDARVFKDKIQALANLLTSSQLPNGQWTYQIGERYSARVRPERGNTGDNSNTQYALLALRAANRAGADIPVATWMRALSFWHMTLTDQGWSYGPLPSGGYSSMTAAGLSSVSICMEGLYVDAGERIANHRSIETGLKALGRDLVGSGYDGVDLYAYYGIERACILTGTRRFNEFDWYAVGAANLVRGQAADGSWWAEPAGGRTGRRGRYGPAIETAYALLFLKRATTRIDGGRDRGMVEVEPRRRREGPPRPRLPN